MIKQTIGIIALILAVAASSFSAETMLDYFKGRLPATTPLAGSDKIPVMQGGGAAVRMVNVSDLGTGGTPDLSAYARLRENASFDKLSTNRLYIRSTGTNLAGNSLSFPASGTLYANTYAMVKSTAGTENITIDGNAKTVSGNPTLAFSDNFYSNLTLKQLGDHRVSTANPHNVTASQLGLATVATSGSYPDLTNKPTIPVACVDVFDGKNATCTVGTTTTGAAGTSAAVTNSGTLSDAVFNFTIPRGDTGAAGTAATIAVGTVTTGDAGTAVVITNSGSSSAATFDFTIPRGDPGTNATVTTSAVLDALQSPVDRALLLQSSSSAEHTRLQINNSGGYLIVGVTDKGLVVVQNQAGVRVLSFDPTGKKLVMKTDSGRTIFSVMSSAAGGTLTL